MSVSPGDAAAGVKSTGAVCRTLCLEPLQCVRRRPIGGAVGADWGAVLPVVSGGATGATGFVAVASGFVGGTGVASVCVAVSPAVARCTRRVGAVQNAKAGVTRDRAFDVERVATFQGSQPGGTRHVRARCEAAFQDAARDRTAQRWEGRCNRFTSGPGRRATEGIRNQTQPQPLPVATFEDLSATRPAASSDNPSALACAKSALYASPFASASISTGPPGARSSGNPPTVSAAPLANVLIQSRVGRFNETVFAQVRAQQVAQEYPPPAEWCRPASAGREYPASPGR